MVRDRDNSPTFVTLGPVLLSAISRYRIEERKRTSLPCLFHCTADKKQGPLSNTHLKAPHSETALPCCPGTGPIFPSATTCEGWGQLSSHNLRVWSSTCCRWQRVRRVGGYLSLIHASGWKMSGKASSPTTIPSGSAHSQLRPALLCFLSDMQGALPSTAPARGGVISPTLKPPGPAIP